MHCLLSCAQDTASRAHFLPPLCPVLVYHSIGAPFYGIKGEFSSWKDDEEALQRKGQDYVADNILQTVWKAIQTVREGEAEFEREGVLFYKKDYTYPLLAALFYSLAGIRKKCEHLGFRKKSRQYILPKSNVAFQIRDACLLEYRRIGMWGKVSFYETETKKCLGEDISVL